MKRDITTKTKKKLDVQTQTVRVLTEDLSNVAGGRTAVGWPCSCGKSGCISGGLDC
ncbi:MAG: hypothetical protein JO257_22510 [Deltaproteobacteria bacterium]|nr:hypothetical protein [Deltaproteobacteria bacterium]